MIIWTVILNKKYFPSILSFYDHKKAENTAKKYKGKIRLSFLYDEEPCFKSIDLIAFEKQFSFTKDIDHGK